MKPANALITLPKETLPIVSRFRTETGRGAITLQTTLRAYAGGTDLTAFDRRRAQAQEAYRTTSFSRTRQKSRLLAVA